MFCRKCRVENRPSAQSCQVCGSHFAVVTRQVATSSMGDLNVAPPVSIAPKAVNANSQPIVPAIWNPSVAGLWSFLLTPAFGAYLQMRNWQALGVPEKAEYSKIWLYLSLAWLTSVIVFNSILVNFKLGGEFSRSMALPMLIGWYIMNGREQEKYVKEKFNSKYPKKPWTKVLLGATAAFVTVCFILVLLLPLG
jgi:hypothetical protein